MALEKTYKYFASFVIQSVNTFLSILKILVQSKFGLKLPKPSGNICVVLANGPSLKTSLEKHPGFFKQHPLICVNTFSVTDEYVQLKPLYYVLIDPWFFIGETEILKQTWKCLEEKTTWQMHLMIPRKMLHSTLVIQLQKKNKNIIITPFNYTVFKGFTSAAHWFYNKNLAMPQSLNVAIPALFLGINIGFKEVYIVGVDHTWHENLHMSNNNILHTKVTHFYENDSEIKYAPFLKGGNQNETQKSYEFFDIWSRTFFAYFVLNNYATKHNCNIYNASEVSFIDAFKRVEL